jgi:hypothetical protein
MPSGMQGAKHTTAEGGTRSFLAVQGPGVPAGGIQGVVMGTNLGFRYVGY